jgi:hypothetical protein
MPLGTLRITLPDSRTREFVVEKPSLGAGRDAANDLVIDDPSVSRRHARLSFEAGRMLVEDLGSSHGTYVGGQRLPANTPSLVPESTAVRLADVELVYLPAPAYQATEAVGGATLADQPTQKVAEASAATRQTPRGGPATTVRASLAGPEQPVSPGGATSAQLVLHNLGSTVDEFGLRVSGVPAAWVRFSKDRVPLLPNAQEQITVTFQPPATAGAMAGEHRFTLTVLSREHHTGINVDGVLRLEAPTGITLGLRPLRSPRDFQVEVTNPGGTAVTYQLSGADDRQALAYHFAQPIVTLEPGQSASIGLSITPRLPPRIGSRDARPFTVIARPANMTTGAEARAEGLLLVRPSIPIWLIPAAIILSLCLCITLAYAYFRGCRTLLPDGPFCPAAALPVINVLSATPSEVDSGGTVVLAWDVTNAERVELVSPTPQNLEPSGLQAFTVTTNTTFLLRATGVAGTVEDSVSVHVRGTAPTIQSFTATPGVITAGEIDTIVLAWTTLNADSVMIEGLPLAQLAPSGTMEVPAPSANTTYTLVATNPRGSARQAVTIVVSVVECSVSGLPAGERLSLRAGPAGAFPVVVDLDGGTRVDPVGRNPSGDWLLLRAAGREGWATASFITCTSAAFLPALPTVAPERVPTLAPTATATFLPPTATGTLLPPTSTPTDTPTPTATATPLFASGGLVTYRVQSGGTTTIYLQNPTGAPVRLVFDKPDAEVLDYTPGNGGRFAIWVSEGGQQKVFIIDRSGQLVGVPITGGWSDVVDADWSYDGQRLVIEAVTAGATNYHYYDANGNALGQPALP